MNRCHLHACRKGLTWLDVLVSMAILAVIVALCLPATRRSRPAAKRTQCKNNLKQLGLALHNYHDTYGRFPSGFVIDTDGVYHGWSWSIGLMPYIDQGSYYNKLNFVEGLQNGYNRAEMNPNLQEFRCPSEPGSHQIGHASVVTTNVESGIVKSGIVDAANIFSRSTYFGNAGYLQVDAGGIESDASSESTSVTSIVNSGSLGRSNGATSAEHRYLDQQRYQGVFGQNSTVTIKDIFDGTSNTIIVGERYIPKSSSIATIGHGTWIGVPDCTRTEGLAMALGDTSVRMNAGAEKRLPTTGFGSPHVGGGYFLLSDGSVRFISEQINIPTYRNLSTIADGKEVSDF